jgi:hypothetical protein
MINVSEDGELMRSPRHVSIYSIFAFGILDIDDARLRRAIEQVEERIQIKTPVRE